MNQPPILLRRQSSLIKSQPQSPSSGNGNNGISDPQLPQSQPSTQQLLPPGLPTGLPPRPPSSSTTTASNPPPHSIPIADEDPGTTSLNHSSHKRKQSGLPFAAEVVRVKSSLTTVTTGDELNELNNAEQGKQGNGTLGAQGESAPLSMQSMEDPFDESDYEHPLSNSNNSSSNLRFKSLFPLAQCLSTRSMSLIVVLFMSVTFYSLQRHAPVDGTDSGFGGTGPSDGSDHNNHNDNPLDFSSTIHRPLDEKKQIEYGEDHMEIVGAPMEAHVQEYNKILFFKNVDTMKKMKSGGPVLWEDGFRVGGADDNDEDGDDGEDNGEGGTTENQYTQYDDDDALSHSGTLEGLHLFQDVCLTNNLDALRYHPMDTSLRGLLYFTDDSQILTHPHRCVPCSNRQPMPSWEDTYADESVVGHKCGMEGLHAMYASSVGDWSQCITREENANLMKEWGQTQAPTQVETVHYFKEPTFLLQFNALDMQSSLFDMLWTYLPHWYRFRNHDSFPFKSVISHSLQGCLSHNHNWFCEVLHQMNAFGSAKEIPWEADDTTMYCYKELFYNQVGYQRELEHEGLVTREVLGVFREILFRKFGLPRRRTKGDREEEEKEKKERGEEDGSEKKSKIIFYDNKLNHQMAWNEMESLVTKARSLEKYQNVKFVTVRDFADLTVAEQARTFNEADAVIMVQGEHMANAIFAVDGTTFVEVGCEVQSLVGNPKFMELFDGKYRSVQKCSGGEGKKDIICVVCDGDEKENFTMLPSVFEKLIDDVVENLSV